MKHLINLFKMRIKRILLLSLTGILLTTLNASAQKNLAFKANISVDGTSNTHDWTVKSDNVPGTFVITEENQISALTFKVSVESLKSILDSKFERKQMENLVLKAFNSEKNPVITFQLTEPFTPVISGSNVTVTLTGNLNMAGVTKRISFKSEGKLIAGGGYQFKASLPLKFTDYGMKPPVALLIMKVKDPVNVKMDITIPIIN